MSTIYIEPVPKTDEVLYLVQSAIKSEVTRLRLALKLARERLAPLNKNMASPRNISFPRWQPKT
jgi:hypothetical protein